jgi:hypothetical protein
MTRDIDPTLAPLDEFDERVLAGVREVRARLDPVPAELADDIKFALSVQALHAEVAELQRLGAEGTLVRSVDYARAETLTFTSDQLSVMVTITILDDARVRLDGWVTATSGVDIVLRQESRSSTTHSDDDGRFAFASVPRGMVQFVFHPTGDAQRPVITPHVEI